MRLSPLFAALGLLLTVPFGHVQAADVSFTRFRGGGPARTDCMLVTDVAGVPNHPGAPATSCRDGDPACDTDATANGSCAFTVRLCVNDAAQLACPPQTVTHVELTAPAPTLAGLAAVLGTMTMPAAPPERCTEAVAVQVPTHGRRRGRMRIRAAAALGSGQTDRDRLALVCYPAPPPATFADIERTVVAVSCASVSCHGPARAGGLSLGGDAAYASLVGVAPANEAARSAGLLRVAPGEPERSFLLDKLLGTLEIGEGTRMPQVGTPLSPRAIDLVRRWIAAGAPASAPF